MTGSLPIKGSIILGAMTPPRSRSPFNRAHLVVRGDGDVILRAQAYTSDERVEGPALSADEWSELVTTEHATALPSELPLVGGAALWILRPGLPRRDRALQDLRAPGLLLHEKIDGTAGAWLCLVDEGHQDVAPLRDRWQREAASAALAHASAGRWERAAEDVEVAHAVARGLDPDALALLHLVYEHVERSARAKGLLAMAQRSRGDAFVAQVIERLTKLRAGLAPPLPALDPPPRRSVRPKYGEAMRRGAEAAHKATLNRIQDAA